MSIASTLRKGVHSVENFGHKLSEKFKPHEKTAIKVAKHAGIILGTIAGIVFVPISTLTGMIFGLFSDKPTLKNIKHTAEEVWNKQGLVGKVGLVTAGALVGWIAGPCIAGFTMGTAFSRMELKPLFHPKQQ